eukprot:scaffold18772_cov112-Isochrysis_galbana.AAC.6
MRLPTPVALPAAAVAASGCALPGALAFGRPLSEQAGSSAGSPLTLARRSGVVPWRRASLRPEAPGGPHGCCFPPTCRSEGWRPARAQALKTARDGLMASNANTFRPHERQNGRARCR